MTGHAAQGLTVDRTFVLATEDTSREWLYMYCSDSNGRWWLSDDADPASDVGPLLAAIDEDATGIFWG